MTPEQENHLGEIKETFCSLVDAKYRKGQEEHGGNLWKKKGLIDMAIEEAIDQVAYLLSLKRQIEGQGIELGESEEHGCRNTNLTKI
jgi:hypothetical protein